MPNKPKIVLIKVDEPQFISSFINKLINEDKYEVSLVIFLNGFISIKRVIGFFLMFGFFNFLQTVFRVLFDYLFIGRSIRLLKKHKIDYLKTKDINDKKLLDKIKKVNPEILLSYHSPKKFKKSLLSIPKTGSINIHYSLLPKYRGIAPIFHALANNESIIGITVHHMDEFFDNGNIVLNISVPTDVNETLMQTYERIISTGDNLIFKSLEKILSGNKETI